MPAPAAAAISAFSAATFDFCSLVILAKPPRARPRPTSLAGSRVHVTTGKSEDLQKIPVSNLCDESKLQPSVFYTWQRQLFENAATVFEGAKTGASSREQELEARIAQLEAKLARKDAVIAEISEEYVQLKKELGEP